MQENTIKAQHTIHVNLSKRLSRGILQQAKGDSSDRVHSDQMVLGTVRWDAGPCEKQPKALKTKLAQGGPSDSSPLRSDGSHDGKAGVGPRERWPKTLKGELENNSRKPRALVRKLA